MNINMMIVLKSNLHGTFGTPNPTREAVAVLFEVPVKVTTALVTPVCVKRILSPMTPPLTRADKFGSTIGIVFTNVTAALAGALIAFIGSAITAVSTIDIIRKRFKLITPNDCSRPVIVRCCKG